MVLRLYATTKKYTKYITYIFKNKTLIWTKTSINELNLIEIHLKKV